jgi:hypothetical protein
MVPPRRDPDERSAHLGRAYHLPMAVWIAFAVLVVALVAAIAFAVVCGVVLWRQAKRTSAALGAETARIARVADEISMQLERADASGTKLSEASARLRSSVERLQLQRAAIDEARAAVRRTFWFLPGL